MANKFVASRPCVKPFLTEGGFHAAPTNGRCVTKESRIMNDTMTATQVADKLDKLAEKHRYDAQLLMDKPEMADAMGKANVRAEAYTEAAKLVRENLV